MKRARGRPLKVTISSWWCCYWLIDTDDIWFWIIWHFLSTQRYSVNISNSRITLLQMLMYLFMSIYFVPYVFSAFSIGASNLSCCLRPHETFLWWRASTCHERTRWVRETDFDCFLISKCSSPVFKLISFSHTRCLIKNQNKTKLRDPLLPTD